MSVFMRIRHFSSSKLTKIKNYNDNAKTDIFSFFLTKKFGGKEILSTFAIPNENKPFATTFPNSSVG